MINKAKSFLKKNIGICIMSGVIICGAITTTMLVKFIPNPHFVINELSISGGPNYRNQDQSLVLKVNIPSNEHSNNDNYICEALGESIDGGKLKTTSLGQPYVSWKLQNINGKSLPKWISISNDDKKDEDENYLFGQIQWDVNQTKNLDHDENFWVMATATFDNIIAYASILYVSFTFDPLTPL